MAKRPDRRPNYENVLANYRRRDHHNNVPNHSAQCIAHMEQKLVKTDAKIEILQSKYERFSRLVEKHMDGQASESR